MSAREKVELVDGSVYWSDDHWVTVWRQLGKGRRWARIIDRTDRDRIRYIAIVQHGGGRDETKDK